MSSISEPAPNQGRKWLRPKRLAPIVLLLILLVLCRACMWRPSDHFGGQYFNRGQNAAWLSVDWVNLPKSDTEISTLSDDLTHRQITYIFVFTTYLQSDGTFNQSYAYATEFLTRFRVINPDLKLLAWIGVPLDDADWGYVDLGDSETRQKLIDLCLELFELGFDGIHLDPEPINNNNRDVIQLLDNLHQALPNDEILSIATPRIAPIFPEISWPLDSLPMWTADYYQQVAQYVDQIVVMTYDSGMPTAWLYRHWVKFQVIEVTQALRDSDVEVLIGISTSAESTNTHHLRAEHMQSGLQGLINGLNDRSTVRSQFTGVAIYPYWETSQADWTVYEDLWLNSPNN